MPFGTDTGISLDVLNQGTGYTFLLTGIAPLFLNPLAEVVGKRPIYLVTILIQAGLYVWAANLKGGGQWIGNSVIRGACLAPAFSICEISVADVVSWLFFVFSQTANADSMLSGSSSPMRERCPCLSMFSLSLQAHWSPL